MNRDRLLALPLSAVLAFCLSVGAVGCMISGFGLPLENGDRLTFVCAAAALAGGVLYLWKWGAAVLWAGLLALAGYLWYQGIGAEELFALANHLSHVYNGAYGWGVLAPADTLAPMDLPMTLIAAVTALAAARPVCRGKGTLTALITCMAPLLSCVVVTDTVPEVSYLFSLMAGLSLLVLTAAVRQESNAQGNRLLLLLLLPVLLALGILFRSTPQSSYVNRSKEIQQAFLSMLEEVPQKVESSLEQLSSNMQAQEQNTVDLKTLGQRQRFTYPVMEVTAQEDAVLYLRGQDYDTYTGTGWMSGSFRAEDFGGSQDPTGTVTIRTRGKKDFLYLPYYPGESQHLAGGLMQNGESLREYTWSYGPMPQPPQVSGSDTVELSYLEVDAFGSTAERLRYLTLPGQTDIRAKEILKTFLPESDSRGEQAQAIAAFVKNTARYDLNTPRMPAEQEDFALWFLSESETGYCVHFATAAVVLLRAADIPARYVTGYMFLSRKGAAVTVTAANAHAWAEYYDPGQNAWIPLEATPGEALYVPEEDATLQTDAPTPVPETQGGRLPETEPGETKDLAPTTGAAEETVPPEAPKASARRVLWLLWLLPLLLQYPLRLKLHQKLRCQGKPNAQALRRWQETQMLSKLRREQPPEMLHILAQKAKFSQHTLTGEELHLFEDYRRASIQWMQNRSWYHQLVYRLILAIY